MKDPVPSLSGGPHGFSCTCIQDSSHGFSCACIQDNCTLKRMHSDCPWHNTRSYKYIYVYSINSISSVLLSIYILLLLFLLFFQMHNTARLQEGKSCAFSSRVTSVEVLSEHKFSKFTIEASQTFYRSPSNLSVAFVNLKPLLPGHVLVTTTRVVPRLSELREEELLDIFRTARLVQAAVCDEHEADSANIGLQDC